MKNLHKSLCALVLGLAAAAGPASADDQNYTPCPKGLFGCGNVKQPPHSLDAKVPAICDEGMMWTINNKCLELKGKVDKGVPDTVSVARTMDSLADLYKTYALKKKYFKDTAKAIREGLLAQFMTPLQQDLTKAPICIWDKKYYSETTKCHMIPVDCFDRTHIEWRMQQLDPMLKELSDDIVAHQAELASGLPTTKYQGTVNLCATWSPPVPCKQHMNLSTNALINAVTAIRQEVAP